MLRKYRCDVDYMLSPSFQHKRDNLEGDIGRGDVGTQGNVTFYRQAADKSIDHSADTGQKNDCRQFPQTARKAKTAKQLEIPTGNFALCKLRRCKQQHSRGD
jgi:hypothetical protein